MDMEQSYIETQFPVSRVSKESYKERKAVQSQTLTGLGKWWGRKPLILVRAAVLGCLMPASDDAKMDREVFLRLLSMDDAGLMARKERVFSPKDLYERITADRNLRREYEKFFSLEPGGKIKVIKEAPRDEMESAVFQTLTYDEKISMCKRPEHLGELPEASWNVINEHLKTNAHSLPELVKELSLRRFGHVLKVGDCFCGGGSIPFEAARIGCDVYASDLNPVATLLTWADAFILGAKENAFDTYNEFQNNLLDSVDRKILNLGIEVNESGDRATNYLYCIETSCPECGTLVPMASSWVIGRGSKTVAKLVKTGGQYDFEIKMDASASEIKTAENGTVTSKGLCCPHCGMVTPISVLRHDRVGADGKVIYGLRQWEKEDFESRPDDVFRERLYAIRYEHEETAPNGSVKRIRYYRSPDEHDMERERKVYDTVRNNIAKWQAEGIIPSMAIELGNETERLYKERGWTHWHQLFNARQVLYNALMIEEAAKTASDTAEFVLTALTVNRIANWNSKLCQWGTGQARESMAQTFYNQALNTMWQYGTRAFPMVKKVVKLPDPLDLPISTASYDVIPKDARNVSTTCDLWMTDPPYADAVNYHELSEFFLSWDRKLINEAFPAWYTDSKRVLAIRGDEHFSQNMIEIYSNLTEHMSENGMQVVMFTHSDPSVWAQLALIMWKAGLTVTAAWNIATETDASGLKDGNYVKGTVLLVLRRQTGDGEAFLDELNADIKDEVQRQVDSMRKLDEGEEPNFSDPDYVLAAYAASLKVLTACRSIGELDLDYELNLAIHDPAKSQVVKIIERARKIAYDLLTPAGFDQYLWRQLSPAERFYIKGLENEKHGGCQVSTYQEYARGYGLAAYSPLMGSERANTARLKTPSEFAMRTVSGVPGFENSVLRTVLAAVHIAVKEDENPEKGLFHLKNNVANYWDRRDMLKELLRYLADCKDIDSMPHWKQCGEMADILYTRVENDRI